MTKRVSQLATFSAMFMKALIIKQKINSKGIHSTTAAATTITFGVQQVRMYLQ